MMEISTATKILGRICFHNKIFYCNYVVYLLLIVIQKFLPLLLQLHFFFISFQCFCFINIYLDGHIDTWALKLQVFIYTDYLFLFLFNFWSHFVKVKFAINRKTIITSQQMLLLLWEHNNLLSFLCFDD